ncbi:MAG: hypothetical protein IJ880_01980 [Bacilli bacterium]|nr:hypothetical protein [Bacilli bacterium]
MYELYKKSSSLICLCGLIYSSIYGMNIISYIILLISAIGISLQVKDSDPKIRKYSIIGTIILLGLVLLINHILWRILKWN